MEDQSSRRSISKSIAQTLRTNGVNTPSDSKRRGPGPKMWTHSCSPLKEGILEVTHNFELTCGILNDFAAVLIDRRIAKF